MKTFEAANKLLIYIIGIITIVSVKHSYILLIAIITFLGLNCFEKKIKRVWKRLCLTSPFLLSAIFLGYFHSDGWTFAFMLILKLLVIVCWNSWILYDFSEQDIVVGLEQLRVPSIFTIIIFFIFRYYKILKEQIQQLQLARQLRGAKMASKRFRINEYKIWAQIIGACLVRSLDKGDRVYQAMQLRGLKSKTLVHRKNKLSENWIALSLSILTAGLIILIDRGGRISW